MNIITWISLKSVYPNLKINYGLLATFAKSFVIGIVVIVYGMVIIVRVIVIRMYIDCLRCGLSQFRKSCWARAPPDPWGRLRWVPSRGEGEVLGTCFPPAAQAFWRSHRSSIPFCLAGKGSSLRVEVFPFQLLFFLVLLILLGWMGWWSPGVGLPISLICFLLIGRQDVVLCCF